MTNELPSLIERRLSQEMPLLPGSMRSLSFWRMGSRSSGEDPVKVIVVLRAVEYGQRWYDQEETGKECGELNGLRLATERAFPTPTV